MYVVGKGFLDMTMILIIGTNEKIGKEKKSTP